ncbi:MAG: hypothetical protein V1744_07095 [Candidatus Altiarchaeota archaeon]
MEKQKNPVEETIDKANGWGKDRLLIKYSKGYEGKQTIITSCSISSVVKGRDSPGDPNHVLIMTDSGLGLMLGQISEVKTYGGEVLRSIPEKDAANFVKMTRAPPQNVSEKVDLK